MKKILLLLAISVLFTQCSSDDSNPVTDDSIEFASFQVLVDGDFFIPESSGKIIVSTADGFIIGDAELLNNQVASVDFPIDPAVTYDLTVYFETITGGAQYHFLNTYQNINPGVYSMTPPRGFNADEDDITITLTNTGPDLEIVSTSSNIVTSESNTNDGGTFIINGPLPASPGFFYASFKSPNDALPRYSWTENASGSTQVNADYTNLPFVEAPITVNFPTNVSSNLTVRGVMDADPQGLFGISHIIQQEETEDGTAQYEVMLPGGVFDNQKLIATYKTAANDNTHRFEKISADLEQNVPSPTLNFTVTNGSLENFSMSTTGEYDVYQANLVYQSPAQDVVVLYDIFGESSADVNFSKTILFDAIFAFDPLVSSDILPNLERITLTNYSQVNTYEDYLSGFLLYGVALLENEFSESVSKF